MEQSVLKSTKKILGIGDDDASFDLDIITHINSAFSILTDLGVGPATGFAIDDADDEWDDFLPDIGDQIKLSKVKNCVFLRTKLWFDPPTSSYLLTAAEKQLQEQEWRLSVNREETGWVDPDPSVPVNSEPSI